MQNDARQRKHAQEMRLMHDICIDARMAARQERTMAANALIIATLAVMIAGVAIWIATAI